MVSALFNPKRWRAVEGFNFKDLTFHRSVDHGTVRIAFNRPEVRNAFRPRTVDELFKAFEATRFIFKAHFSQLISLLLRADLTVTYLNYRETVQTATAQWIPRPSVSAGLMFAF